MQEKSVKQVKFEKGGCKGRAILKLNLWILYIVMCDITTDPSLCADGWWRCVTHGTVQPAMPNLR
jgi:hypothetical protein